MTVSGARVWYANSLCSPCERFVTNFGKDRQTDTPRPLLILDKHLHLLNNNFLTAFQYYIKIHQTG
jgi:hypothetical protein